MLTCPFGADQGAVNYFLFEGGRGLIAGGGVSPVHTWQAHPDCAALEKRTASGRAANTQQLLCMMASNILKGATRPFGHAILGLLLMPPSRKTLNPLKLQPYLPPTPHTHLHHDCVGPVCDCCHAHQAARGGNPAQQIEGVGDGHHAWGQGF